MSPANILKNLLLLALLTSLLISGCAPLKSQLTQSEIIHSVSDQIASFEIPTGYQEQFAVDMLGYQLVSLVGPTPSCHIFLVQAPKDTETDIEAMVEQARQLNSEQKDSEPRDMHTVEIRTANLRGQEVEVLVSEGLNGENEDYRQATALFEGRGGPSLVSVAAPVSQWDWAQVDKFLASLE